MPFEAAPMGRAVSTWGMRRTQTNLQANNLHVPHEPVPFELEWGAEQLEAVLEHNQGPFLITKEAACLLYGDEPKVCLTAAATLGHQ
jgi:hypothetical protein